jgi:hypothetical protein
LRRGGIRGILLFKPQKYKDKRRYLHDSSASIYFGVYLRLKLKAIPFQPEPGNEKKEREKNSPSPFMGEGAGG